MNVKLLPDFFVPLLKIRLIIILLSLLLVVIVYLSGVGFVPVPYLASAQNTSSPSSSSSPPAPLKTTNTSTATVDGIQCNVIEHLEFHIHAHIDILINGKHISIPPQIGIVPGKCIYWMHTHDASGIIHIESPVKRDFTLGQFFDIWKMKSSNPKAFDTIFNGNIVPSVYINGTKVPSTTNYRDIKLSAHQQIAIAFGKPPAQMSSSIPSTYKFPPGL